MAVTVSTEHKTRLPLKRRMKKSHNQKTKESFHEALHFRFYDGLVFSQTDSRADSQEVKHILTTMPSGARLTIAANTIDKDWTSSIIHLKGNVLVEVWAKNSPKITILHADEVDYNETTGKLSPRGNVDLIVNDRH
jgi:lipopolysaccharide assembly outer membrane protein LptD (OstA)